MILERRGRLCWGRDGDDVGEEMGVILTYIYLMENPCCGCNEGAGDKGMKEEVKGCGRRVQRDEGGGCKGMREEGAKG